MKKYFVEDNHLYANSYRKNYFDGVKAFAEHLTIKDDDSRKNEITPEHFARNQDYYRNVYINMLGYPLTDYQPTTVSAHREYVGKDDYCEIYRITIETIDSIQFYGILTVPIAKCEKYPLLITQHGGGGTPELLMDMHGTNNYSHISKIASENGFAVFAPQLLLWNYSDNENGVLSYGKDLCFNRQEIDNTLKRSGSSITALEIYNIRKSLDYLTTLDFIDDSKIGMIGLSYGGYFTLHTMAADQRIKAGYSCAAFSDRSKICFADWSYDNSNKKLHDAEVAALCAPRALFIDVGKSDEVFDYRPAIAEAKRAKELYRAFGEKAILRFNLWEGGHRIDVDGPYINEFFHVVKEGQS